jgi:signal transduction histidine kinase/CheY-like chemotaxis protein
MVGEELALKDELASLRAVLGKIEMERSDLEIELQAAIEHGDAIEAELALANDQMRAEIVERIRAESKLQRLLGALSEQKADLELLVHTITQHSDEIDIEQELANEQLRLENERIRLAKEQAETLARAKTEFVAVVSHEVRTPMNGLLGMTRLLLDTQLTHEQRDIAETVLSSGRLLLSILDELLDLSKIEAGRLQIEQVEVKVVDLVEESFGLMSMRATEGGLAVAHTIAPDVPAMVVGDPLRLRQVLINLVGNAIKFTEKGSITLRVERTVGERTAGDGSDSLLFSVADTGIGISDEAQARLFNRYVQAAAWVSRKFGGTGLGLSISRQLIELMGGEIGVTSTPGKGSVFWFRVPLIAATDSGTRVRPAHPPARVLLIESDDAVRHALVTNLNGWGIEVVGAAPDTVETLRRPGDLLVVGGRLPQAAARRLAHGTGLPTIILSPAGTLASPDQGNSIQILTEPVREAALADALDWFAAPTVEHHDRPAGNASKSPAESGPGLVGLTVLVVEDNPVNRRVACGMLARLGHTVLTADDGAQALDMVRSYPIDLILMDRHMPVMDGLEAVRAIRALPSPACDLPVVALTAAATSEEVRECLAAGMNDFIPKPFMPEQLTEIIGRVRGQCEEAEFDVAYLTMLREIMGDDMVAAMVPEYFTHAQALLAEIDHAVTMRDGKGLVDAAHSLSSCSAQVGLMRVHRMCRAIESTIRGGRLEDALRLADQLPAAYARGRAWLCEG